MLLESSVQEQEGGAGSISCSPMRVARVKVVVAMSSMLYLVPSRGLDWRNEQHLH